MMRRKGVMPFLFLLNEVFPVSPWLKPGTNDCCRLKLGVNDYKLKDLPVPVPTK